jgi:hypothetical protein
VLLNPPNSDSDGVAWNSLHVKPTLDSGSLAVIVKDFPILLTAMWGVVLALDLKPLAE